MQAESRCSCGEYSNTAAKFDTQIIGDTAAFAYLVTAMENIGLVGFGFYS